MKLYRASEYKRMPWKNGGGETVEIAVFPPDASVDDFDWRISMAMVASDGPFSIFPGIDRTLSILDGSGMSLSINGAVPIVLTETSEPLSFTADVPVDAVLVDGPITDLNVMTRRGRFSHRVERKSSDVLIDPSPIGDTIFILATGQISLKTEGQVVVLDALDAALIDRQAQIITGHAAFHLISLRAV
ncbi:HutD family protein [Agrobacterium vaccinii]|uniref:HutD/Ves family protein n=1 Tax=Agrobacterium vaccinii TaxID=2735528 RepID=UPI001E59450E|nr:HutD family protein [Agrobacterium vaccinii]UHS60121.1 HutD family protein [Agrobacterium vaccinii]